MEMKSYENTKFYIGRGSISNIKTFGKERIALVIDSRAVTQTLDNVKNILEDSNISYEIVADIQREPHMSDVDEV